MKQYRALASFILFILLFLGACTPSARYLKKINKAKNDSVDTNYIRVLIGTSKSPVDISVNSPFKVFRKKGRRIVYETKRGILKFYPERVREPYVIESSDSPIYVNNKGYRGSLEIYEVMGKLYLVNVVNVEHYLYSVVPSEMPAGWNIEALKAQAVAARTYTFYHLTRDTKKKQIYQVDCTTRFQVYKGIASEKELSTKAVNETAGMIMTYDYSPILAYFHSTSGGITADDRDVWTGNDLPYLESVDSKYEKQSPHYKWATSLSIYEIKKALMKKYRQMGAINKIAFKKKNGRVTSVVIVHTRGTINLTGNHFRLLFPPKKLRSTFFISQKRGNSLFISGKGWGHGVGMSQWGARGMADSGISFDKILKHFYKGISLTKRKNPYFASESKKGGRQLVN